LGINLNSDNYDRAALILPILLSLRRISTHLHPSPLPFLPTRSTMEDSSVTPAETPDLPPILVRSQHLKFFSLYIFAIEEICQPELIVVDQRINAVKCLVETREMLGDQPIYAITIMQDLLERMTALTMSQGCLNDGCSSSKNNKPFSNCFPMKILFLNCRGAGNAHFFEA
jgi:hypothetical protein